MCRRFFHDHMRIRAAQSERTHRCQAATSGGCGPVLQLRVDAERTIGERDVRVRRIKVQRRRNLPVLHGQQHFDQPRHTRCGTRVADVGLDRTERTETCPIGVMAERAGQRRGLDRVAENGACAVRLDQLQVRGIDPERVVDVPLQAFLRGSTRCGDAIARTVLIDRAAFDHAVDVIARVQGILQAFEHHHTDALGRHEAVRRCIERATFAGRREHPGATGGDQEAGCALDPHAAGEGDIRLARPQALTGQMRGDQRTRASGIERDRRALQIEMVGDARGQYRCGVAPHRMRRKRRLHLQQFAVIAAVEAHVDAATRARDALAGVTGVLQRMPGFFQQQTMLRIHVGGFGAGDIEEQRIEQIDVAQESAAGADADIVRQRGGIDVPARDRLGHFMTRGQMRPQCLQVVRLRETAAHADDGDRAGRSSKSGARPALLGR